MNYYVHYSPLDELIDKLGGPERVAEMTGRRSRIVRRSGEVTVESRAPDANCLDSLNVREVVTSCYRECD